MHQPTLPLDPPPPTPQQVQDELHRLWRRHPRWQARYSSVQALLDSPQGPAIERCARQTLVQRQREALRRTKNR